MRSRAWKEGGLPAALAGMLAHILLLHDIRLSNQRNLSTQISMCM